MLSLGCVPVDALEAAFHTPTTPSARASTPRSRRSCSAGTRSGPGRRRRRRSSTGSRAGTTASGATPGSATARPPTTNTTTTKGVIARTGRTRRPSLKKEQELLNVYVSTEPRAVQFLTEREGKQPRKCGGWGRCGEAAGDNHRFGRSLKVMCGPDPEHRSQGSDDCVKRCDDARISLLREAVEP
jgi:hypothetical protein